MQAERDYLKHIVFPRVEEELQQRRIKLEIVDLRWGVDTTSIPQEDEREANVLKVCLDEIRRCRPFFIGLLGDRYGWVPPIERMKNALVGENLVLPQEGKSVTDLEIEFGVLARQEQLVRSVFYFRNPLSYHTFSEKKAAMYSDEYNNELGALEKKERKTALENLKTNIREHFDKRKLGEKVKTYRGAWDADDEKLVGLEAWGDMVYDDILSECKSHANATWDKVPQNWQEEELSLLDAFIEHNTAAFCGRRPLLESLKRHLLSDDPPNWGLVLTGESGSGKSAVFSMVAKTMQQENCLILAHSAGLSPRAKSVADLLQIWNRQLARFLGIQEELKDISKSADSLDVLLSDEKEKKPAAPIEKLQEKFQELLQLAAAKKRVLLLIDALDRFEPTARAQYMSWLPSLMPQNVSLLCTTITGAEQKAVQYHKGIDERSIDIFSEEEAKEMLSMLCLKQHKTLSGKIEKIILEKKRADGQPATASPLWLSLAVNMLMAIDIDDFEKMSRLEGRGDQQIENYMMAMANGFDALPGPLFLSLTKKAGILFGETFTAAIFNCIAISRNGLREKDLEKLLEAENIEWVPLQFASLRRWFKAHMVLQGEEFQWNMAHSILHSAITEYADEKKIKHLHGNLSSYLLSLRKDSLRNTETMYHLMQKGIIGETLEYYISDLSEEENAGATRVLSDTITANQSGQNWISSMIDATINSTEKTFKLASQFYELNNALKIEGRLKERLQLLELIFLQIRKECSNWIPNKYAITFSLLCEEIGEIYKYHGNFDKAMLYFTDLIQYIKNLQHDYNLQNENIPQFDNYLKEIWAVSCRKVGEIFMRQGNFEEALKFYNEDLKLTKELLERNFNNISHKQELAIIYDKLGLINKELGNLEQALNFFNNNHVLIIELYENYPQNEKFKDGLAVSYERVGTIYHLQGKFDQALKYYKLRGDLGKMLYESNPQNEKFKDGLAVSYGRLGHIYTEIGKYDKALKFYNDYNILRKELYESNPQSEKLKEGLASSYLSLGRIYNDLGKFDQALAYFKNNLELTKELYESNPENEINKIQFADSHGNLGSIYQELGNFDRAFKYLNDYNLLCKEFYKSNPQNENLKISLAFSYGKLGEIHKAMGHLEEALNYFNEKSRLFKELCEANPRNESLKDSLATSYEKLGAIHQAMGHMEEAVKYFEDYNQFSKELYEANPRNESLKKGLASSYGKLGGIHQEMGHFEKALKYFEEYRKLSEELNQANPQNESLKQSLAVSLERLGYIHQSMGFTEAALKYFEDYNLLSKELYEANPCSESHKESLATSYGKLGEIHQSMGHTEEALKHFENDRELSEELYEANPRNESLKGSLATSYQFLGFIHQSMGHLEEALNYFEDYNLLSKELYEANPRNESLKASLAISYQFLGNTHQSMGHLEEAVNFFEDYNLLSKELYEANPRNESLKASLATSYQFLGIIHQSMGHLEEALNFFEDYNLLSKELNKANPGSESLKNGLAVSYEKLGKIHQSMGHLEEALKYFELRFELGKKLYEANTRSEPLKQGVAISYSKLGEIHQAMGHMESALKKFENFRKLSEELYEANPRNESLRNGLVNSYMKLGSIHHDMGNIQEALKYFDDLNRLFKELYQNNPHNESLKTDLANSYGKLGEILQELGHTEEAMGSFKEYRKLTEELYETNPQNIDLLEGLGISYYQLAMLYKSTGNHRIGQEHFAQWKNIISHLAKNLPQIEKYWEWDQVEY